MTNNKNTTLSKNEIFVNEIVFYNRDNISLLGFVQQGRKYAEAEYIISRAHLNTLLLNNGRSGREVKRHIEQLFATPLHPYTEALFRAIPRIDRAEQNLESIAGQVPSIDRRPAGCRFAPR